MRYSFEFKMKCVELYRKGTWVETPENVMQESFRRKILNWDKIEKIHGPKGLERVKKQRNWTVEEKLTFVLQVLTGKALSEVAFPAGISVGLSGEMLHLVRKDDSLPDAIQTVQTWKEQLTTILTLVGADSISSLQQAPIVVAPSIQNWCDARGIDWKHLAQR